MKEPVILHVNGVSHTVNTDPSTPLLYILRNELSLNGPKYGCGLQQCGACMVLLDGKAHTSCMLPVSSIKGRSIITLEGLSQKDNEPHPVQKAFVEEQATQCGYCLNGMVITAVSLLAENSHPDDKAIRNSLELSLCRCGSHARILRAIKRATELL
jgi:nicotinate dehydrogenase subunit A